MIVCCELFLSCRYQMKRTIQFESHRNELAAILELEHDPDVIELYDQPPPIQLHYRTAKGKAASALHTPDFFVIGYGLDYAERYRNLPFVGVLRPSVYRQAQRM